MLKIFLMIPAVLVVLKNTVLYVCLCPLDPQAEVNLATALVPSLMACLANSPGSISRTAV